MTDLYKPVPPSLSDPPSILVPPSKELPRIGVAFVQDQRPTERKYVKKGIIVEGVDKSVRLSIARRSMFY